MGEMDEMGEMDPYYIRNGLLLYSLALSLINGAYVDEMGHIFNQLHDYNKGPFRSLVGPDSSGEMKLALRNGACSAKWSLLAKWTKMVLFSKRR